MGDDFVVRLMYAAEPITFRAHAGVCRYCGGVVKMCCDPRTLMPLLDQCWCLQCGQSYFVEGVDDVVRWEAEQWAQKAER